MGVFVRKRCYICGMKEYKSLDKAPFGKGVVYTVKLDKGLDKHGDLLEYIGDKVVIDEEEHDVLGVFSKSNGKLYESELIGIFVK